MRAHWRIWAGLFLTAMAAATAVFLLAHRPTPAQPGIIHAFNPRLDVSSGPRIRKALSELEAFLRTADRHLPPALAGQVSRTISGAYGSGFLRLNQVGNDLDAFANVHLGTIAVSAGDTQGAARVLLERVESYRRAAQAAAEKARSPALSLHRFMDTLPRGSLAQDPRGLTQVARSLQHALAEEPYLATVFHRGMTQVSIMAPGEVYLPYVTNVLFYSNVVDHRQEVFWGIRGISLQVYFTVNLDVEQGGKIRQLRAVPVYPLALARQVTKLWQQALTGVFASGAAAERFAADVLPRIDPAQARLVFGLGLLESMAFELDVRRYPVKFLKRLHLFLDALGPAWDPAFRQRVEDLVRRGLRGDAALFADQVKTLSHTLGTLAGDDRLMTTFRSSGDVAEVLNFLNSAVEHLERHEGIAGELGQARGELTSLRAKVSQNAPQARLAFREAAFRLSDLGLQMVRALSGPAPELQRLRAAAERVYVEAGYRPLRLYSLPRGKMAVDARDLSCGEKPRGRLAELTRALVPTATADLTVVDPDAAAAAGRPAADSPVHQLPQPAVQYVRCDESPPSRTRYRDLLGRLSAQRLPLTLPPATVAVGPYLEGAL